MTKTTKEKETLKGNIADIGRGLNVKHDPSQNADVLVETNLMASKIYDSPDINTSGLRSVGGYIKKKANLSIPVVRDGVEIIPVIKDITLEETKGGILIKGDISTGEVLNTLNTTPNVLRAPKVLALKKDILPDDAHDVLIEANNRIIANNIAKKRADSLNVIMVPEEEFNRRAILGEVEHGIFGEFGKKGVHGEYLSLKEQAGILRQFKKGIQKQELLLGNSLTNASALKNIEMLKQDMKNQLELPEKLVFNHPYEKRREIDPDTKKPTGKLIPKEVIITDIEYDILNDSASFAQNPSIYGNDDAKIFVKGGKVTVLGDGDTKEINKADFSKEITFDCGKEDSKCGNDVLGEIYEFQPEQVDLRKRQYDTLDSNASGTTKMGSESVSKPYMPKELKEIIFDAKKNPKLGEWLQDPEHLIRFENYQQQLDEFEKTSDRIPQVQCENGKIQVRRKRSPQAWGMTPKQKVCKMGNVETRDTLLNRKLVRDTEIDHQKNLIEDELIKQKLVKSKKEITNIAIKRADAILNEDPDYKRIVGCNTEEERQKVEQIDNENAMRMETGDELIPLYKVPMRFPTKNAMGDTLYCKTYKNASPNVRYQLYEQTEPLIADKDKDLFTQFVNANPNTPERQVLYSKLLPSLDPKGKEIVEIAVANNRRLKKDEIEMIRGKTQRLPSPKINFREETLRKKSFLLVKQDTDK